MSCLRIAIRVSMLWCIFLAASPAWGNSLALEAGSAVLMDLRSKRLLYEQDSMRKIPPASLTKVMSMFIVLDAVKAGKLSLRTSVQISKAAAHAGGSSMHLKTRERIRLDDLLRGMAVVSANDASVAVAEHVAGSQAAFVDMMNRKAKQLGLKNTVFKTPHGLPAKGQVTTADDMLRLASRYLEAHPAARYYHSTPAILHNGILMQNTNKLLGHDSVNGLKTGFTRESGYCIILTSNRNGREMVGVLMRAPSGEVRNREAQRLLEYGANIQAALKHNTGKTRQAVAAAPPAPAKKGKASSLPRRILPPTAGLTASPQGSQLR